MEGGIWLRAPAVVMGRVRRKLKRKRSPPRISQIPDLYILILNLNKTEDIPIFSLHKML